MALPEDFNKIYGSTATGGLTPISDVNYAKGWEFVGSNPPTKNDFSYLQNLSDRKSQYLYKVIGGESGAPAIGIPFFWPSAAMPNAVMTEWADMVFLKFNGATFSASEYPKLALVFPGLALPEARGEFLRIWDDGRGVDSGRAILSAQGDAIREITGRIYARGGTATSSGAIASASGVFSYDGEASGAGDTSSTLTTAASPAKKLESTTFSVAASGLPTANENRPRNIAFNFLVRAK